MDEFAQSRGDDDLFDDDLVPLESVGPSLEVEPVVEQLRVISLDQAPQAPAADLQRTRGRHATGGRGTPTRDSKRGQGRQQTSSLMQSIHAPPSAKAEMSSKEENAPDSTQESSKEPEKDEDEMSKLPVSPGEAATPTHHPEAAESAIPSRPPAVRGDRTATGGIKKPKLTEEELTAKLAAAKTRSENLSAAHARAEADAANFAQREKVAADKRRKDAVNNKAMEGEREKNRARKMAVMGGREWDAEKNEEDFRVGRGRGRGNSHGRGSGRPADNLPGDDDLSQYQWKDNINRGRGRGFDGGRGGRGRGRGRAREQGQEATPVSDMKNSSAFPALPSSADTDKASKPGTEAPKWGDVGSDVISPTVGNASWADQVESSERKNPRP